MADCKLTKTWQGKLHTVPPIAQRIPTWINTNYRGKANIVLSAPGGWKVTRASFLLLPTAIIKWYCIMGHAPTLSEQGLHRLPRPLQGTTTAVKGHSEKTEALKSPRWSSVNFPVDFFLNLHKQRLRSHIESSTNRINSIRQLYFLLLDGLHSWKAMMIVNPSVKTSWCLHVGSLTLEASHRSPCPYC